MKSLIEYIADISTIDQEPAMKPSCIMAEQTDGNEAVWNSSGDRWSRKAKHQLKKSEMSSILDEWSIGDIAIYEGQQVEISIPNGPNSTVGIIISGKTKMVNETKLSKLDEGVMGGLKPLDPINRMVQLAGISVPATISSTSDQINEEEITKGAIDSIYKSNLSSQFKNNPAAAKLAAVGQVLVSLGQYIDDVKDTVDQESINKIANIDTIGAAMISTARAMLTQEKPT